METKHTPGPWAIDKTSNADSIELIVTSTHLQGQDDDVCSVYGGNDNNEQTREANARLIASAPELLEALETALTEISPAFNFDQAKYPEWVKQIQSAIKKAKGQ